MNIESKNGIRLKGNFKKQSLIKFCLLIIEAIIKIILKLHDVIKHIMYISTFKKLEKHNDKRQTPK